MKRFTATEARSSRSMFLALSVLCVSVVQMFFTAHADTVREYFEQGHYESGERRWDFRGYDGTPEARFDDDGVTVGASRYSAFGQRISDVGDNVNRQAFQGLDFRKNVDQYNLGVRNMDPVDGQWGQPEPKNISGAPLLGSPYRYAANNPINLADPTGLAPDFNFG